MALGHGPEAVASGVRVPVQPEGVAAVRSAQLAPVLAPWLLNRPPQGCRWGQQGHADAGWQLPVPTPLAAPWSVAAAASFHLRSRVVARSQPLAGSWAQSGAAACLSTALSLVCGDARRLACEHHGLQARLVLHHAWGSGEVTCPWCSWQRWWQTCGHAGCGVGWRRRRRRRVPGF